MRSLICCIVFCCLSVSSVFSQDFDYTENAVYIYNFIKYTTWPQKKAGIVVGVIGKTPVEGELRKLLSKKSGSLDIAVQHISPADARNADVVVVAYDASAELKELAAIKHAMLIITEKDDMGGQGACISFFRDADNDYKTGYQLSLRNCRQRGLIVGQPILDYAVLMR